MSAVETLREAAKVLRELVEGEPTDWEMVDFNEGSGRPLWGVANDAFFNPPEHGDEPWLAVEVHTGQESTARYIATMHPGVALALADWLDAEAQGQGHDPSEHDGSPSGYALRVAEAILGGAR